MNIFCGSLSLLLLLWGALGETTEPTLQFAISIKPTNEITLLLHESEYPLERNDSGWLLPTLPDMERIKKGLPSEISWEEFLIWIQAFYAFQTTPKGQSPIGTVQDLFYKFEGAIPFPSLLKASPHIAFLLGRRDQLRQLLILSRGEDKAQCYFYLTQLEKNWLLERALLAEGLWKFPSNRRLRQAAQFFSLSVAEAILKSYEAELFHTEIFKILGMKEKPEGFFESVWYSRLGQGLFNTTNLFTVLLTDYEDNLLLVWENQMDQIRKIKSAISELKLEIMNGCELSELQGEKWLEWKDHNFALTQSPFFKRIIERGLYFGENYRGHYLPYPSLSSLGIEIAVDFIDDSQWYTAAGEKNIEKFSTYDDGMIPPLPIPHTWRNSWLQFSNLFNLFTLGALPGRLRWFTGTSLGKKTIDTLHLHSLLKWIETHVPERLVPVALFLAMEVPDGHIIYIIRLPILAVQTALGAFEILSDDDRDIKKIKGLIQKQFSSQN